MIMKSLNDDDMKQIPQMVLGNNRARQSTGGLNSDFNLAPSNSKAPSLNSKHYKILSKRTIASVQALKPKEIKEYDHLTCATQSTAPSSTRSSFSTDVSSGTKRHSDASCFADSLGKINEDDDEASSHGERSERRSAAQALFTGLSSLSTETIDVNIADDRQAVNKKSSDDHGCDLLKQVQIMLKKHSEQSIADTSATNNNALSANDMNQPYISGFHQQMPGSLDRSDSNATVKYNDSFEEQADGAQQSIAVDDDVTSRDKAATRTDHAPPNSTPLAIVTAVEKSQGERDFVPVIGQKPDLDKQIQQPQKQKHTHSYQQVKHQQDYRSFDSPTTSGRGPDQRRPRYADTKCTCVIC